MKLNLGCGARPIDGYLGVDLVAQPGVDVVHDLDVGPWPWKDGEVTHVYAEGIFEHVEKPLLFMSEAHRILEPGGMLYLVVPHWRHEQAYTDPTHRRFCTEHTFDYWIAGTVLHRDYGRAYGGFTFAPLEISVHDGNIWALLQKPGA